MRYQNIHSQIWIDEKFIELSSDGKMLFLYVMTSPHSNTIGIYVLPKMYMACDLGWDLKRLSKPFRELLDKQMVLYDERVNLLCVKNHVKYNPIENENQSKSASKILDELPKSHLFQILLEQLNKQYHEPLRKRLAERYAKPETETETETETPPTPSRGKADGFTPEKLALLWNEKKPDSLPKVNLPINGNRNKKALQSIKTRPEPEFWGKTIEAIFLQPFLTGENDRLWKADFDFMLRKFDEINELRYKKDSAESPDEHPLEREMRLKNELRKSQLRENQEKGQHGPA